MKYVIIALFFLIIGCKNKTHNFYVIRWADAYPHKCLDSMVLCNWAQSFEKGDTVIPRYFHVPVIVCQILGPTPNHLLHGNRIDTLPNVIYRYGDLFETTPKNTFTHTSSKGEKSARNADISFTEDNKCAFGETWHDEFAS